MLAHLDRFGSAFDSIGGSEFARKKQSAETCRNDQRNHSSSDEQPETAFVLGSLLKAISSIGPLHDVQSMGRVQASLSVEQSCRRRYLCDPHEFLFDVTHETPGFGTTAPSILVIEFLVILVFIGN